MDLFVFNIEGIDEKRQTFSIRGFLEIKWQNDFLKWNPEEFVDIYTISVPIKNIWIPDLGLTNGYDNPTDLGQAGGRAVVDHNGSCVIWPYKIYTVGCKINIRKFPFDIQVCYMELISYTLPVTVLKIRTSENIGFHSYEQNSEWALDSSVVKQYESGYAGTAYDHVLVRFTLRRKWLFHLLNMIVPIVCISLLNTACFITPSESGERISLCISIFLTLAVFLTIISSSLPESSDEISLFGVYVGLQLVGSGLTILATIISLRLFHREQKEPVCFCYRVLSKLFCQASFTTNSNNVYIQSNGQIPIDSGISKASEGSSCNKMVGLTWIAVSHAFDRMCFFLSIVWNIGLAIGLIFAFQA